jgi:cellobiose phosphorylase
MPRAPGPCPDSTVGPPIRQVILESRLHQGISPEREREWRAVHACAIWVAMAFAALGDHRRAWELFAMINPVSHARSPDGVATYRVEPYVVAADVYACPPHTGRASPRNGRDSGCTTGIGRRSTTSTSCKHPWATGGRE